MAESLTLTNARIVTRDAVVPGHLTIVGDRIGRIDQAQTEARTVDLDGDFLLPGLIELHTDNLERHYAPRSGVIWDPVAAAMNHDAQMVAAGITTVLDSLTVSGGTPEDPRGFWAAPLLAGLAQARAAGLLKAQHFLHLRCEITQATLLPQLEGLLDQPDLRLLSLMDHAPGDRQSPDLAAYRQRCMKNLGMDEAAADAWIAGLMEGSRRHGPANAAAVAELARRHGLVLASHDDASAGHAVQAAELGCAIAEFPTTLAAASTARDLGLAVLMGAPNLLLGQSHSGNIAAAALAEARLIDIISSDYVPGSLLPAIMRLAGADYGYSLPEAVAMASAEPAIRAGLADRGQITPGRRADLIQVRMITGRPLIRAVWIAGERVA